jgi:VIT1/CCC1 family predicted Fe2+/Mn2+ transporter
MPPVLRIALLAGAALLILLTVFGLLAGGDPPTSRVEQVIPNERFAR